MTRAPRSLHCSRSACACADLNRMTHLSAPPAEKPLPPPQPTPAG
jgi:hypothetical protein